MALFLRLTIVDDGGIENVIRQEAAMEVGKSKAIPKALWLALLLVGLMTSYNDLKPRRMARADASSIETKIHSARLAQESWREGDREAVQR
jgi:hypothetical protein